MDPVKLQKLIADYKASHPSVKHNTDAEIISIMCNDASVNKADAAQLSQLLAGSNNSVGDGFSRTTAVNQTSKVLSVIVSLPDGRNCNLNKTIELRINNASKSLADAEKSNGFIGKSWSGFKNLTGIGDSSDDVRELIKSEEKLLKTFNSNLKQRPVIFKELTGVDYTPENLENFLKGQIKLKSEIALNEYKDGQKMVVDLTSDIAAGVVSYAVTGACIAGGVAAAPFTAGASLSSIAVGIGAGTAAGAATKTLLKAGDACSGGRKYTSKELVNDVIIGGVSGALAPVTMGVGGAVANTTLKVAPKVVANTARYSVEGAMFGSVDGGTRAALEGGSVSDIAVASLEGAAAGVVAGNVFGHTGNAVSKGVNNLKAGSKAKKVISSIVNDKYSKIKLDDKDKSTILHLSKQGLDMADYDVECIIRFLKQNGEYSQADIDLVVSLIKNFEGSDVVFNLFRNLDFEKEYCYISPEQLKNIMQGVKDLPADVVRSVLGEGRGANNFIWFSDAHRWSGNSLNLFTKILPESKGLQPKTQEYLLRIVKAYQKGGLDALDNAKIKEMTDVLKSLSPAEKNIFKKVGMNIEKLLDDLEPKLTGYEVRVNKTSQNRFLKTVVGNNNPVSEDIISSRTFKSYLSQLEQTNSPIPLKYSRQEFAKDLEELLSKLPAEEKTKVLNHLNIELNGNNFSGFVKAEDFNYKEFAPEAESILKAVKSKVDDFVLNNEAKVSDPQIKQMLDDLIQGFPEFTSIIGKIDADHANCIDIHTLQVLSEAISHPDYNTLSHFEKTMLKFSILMHDIGKVEGQKTAHWEKSATYARSILDKFNLSQEMKEGIVNLIKYHHFGEQPNRFYNYFRTPEQQNVAKILGDSDYIARFKSSNGASPVGSPLPGLADNLQITQNSTAVVKYPKRTYTLKDGRKVSVGVSDMRNVSYDAQASDFGWYSGKSLGNTKVQVHNCSDNHNGTYAEKIKNILQAYLNPNKDMTLSTTVTTLDKIQKNGYGKVSLILSTAKGNNVVVSGNGAGNATGGKKGLADFLGAAYNPSAKREQLYLSDVNEVFALNPKVEQIALRNVAPENIPLDLIEIAAQYNIPIVLLP